jgi:hypothetical protein
MIKRLIVIVLLLMFSAVGLPGAQAAESTTAQPAAPSAQPELTEFSDLSDKTVSMLTGAPFEELVRYNGPRRNILEHGDDLSRSMLTGFTKGISYETRAADDLANCLTLVFGETQ